MEWRPYKPCCAQSALDLEASFCSDCGAPLLRCMAFTECFKLVEPLKPCPTCVSPEVWIESGAVLDARVGERLSIPLVLKNGSQVERHLVVKAALKRESGKPEERIPLSWETLDANSERSVYLEAGPFEVAGDCVVEIILMTATRYKALEEVYAFGGAVRVSVQPAESDGPVASLNLSNAQLSDNVVVHMPTHNRGGGSADRRKPLDRRAEVALQRFQPLELSSGLRGDTARGLRIARSVSFSFKGFPQGEAPRDGVGLGARNALDFGRLGRRFDAEKNPSPNDVTLRAYSGGELDRDASMRISRHHLTLVVANDRLCLQPISPKGASVNGETVPTGEIRPLTDGDRVAPLAEEPGAVGFTLHYGPPTHGVVDKIELRRDPFETAAAASGTAQGATR